MKTLLLLLLLFSSAQAQNVWYVDRDSPASTTTQANGRSWATAWKSLDSSAWTDFWGVNWNLIGDGDTIYVSGGADSTTYYPIGVNNWYNGIRREAGVNHTFNQQVVIAPAWHPGHNGEVFFTRRNNTTGQIFLISNVNNVKVTGIKIIETKTDNSGGNAMVSIYGRNNALDNCYIFSKGNVPILGMEGTYLTVQNCTLDMAVNDLPNDIDALGASPGGGGHLIDRNTIIMRNGNVGTTSHRDIIQFGGQGDTNSVGYVYRTTVFSNNLIMDKREEGDGWNAMMYFVGQRNHRFLIFNNILYSRKKTTSLSAIWFDGYVWKHLIQSAEIYNNTIILRNQPPGGAFVISNIDTTIVKNNIFVLDTTFATQGQAIQGLIAVPASINGYKDIDYNHWARLGGIGNDNFGYSGINGIYTRTWTEWIGDGLDTHSDTSDAANVVFINKGGETIESYYTQTGRGKGLNLYQAHPELLQQYPALGYDILGNPRPLNGPWDIGALQHQGGQSNYINVQGKIFLQGPLYGNLMKTELADSCSCIPLQQPYNAVPWNYSGTESLIFPGGQPGSGYVDWVLVELRNSSNPVEVVGRRAAVLRNDGTLLEPDGSVGVRFNNMQEGSYYIAVFHRNHLAVMSALPVYLNSNSQSYDFTNAMNKAYGINPMADLGNGIFTLYSGDGNSNGGVNILDKNGVWQQQNGNVGYLNGDFNLNGGVNVIDMNDFWSINNGTEAQLPENE